MTRAIVIIMDSVGIGAMPDAAAYGDTGSNTIVHISKAVGGLKIPNLTRMGLANITDIPFIAAIADPAGNYGKMSELSPGKDTTTGHWEISGIVLNEPFPTFPSAFPKEFIKQFELRIGRETLGNEVASGTEIIERLGVEHMRTGKPIVYTSADSVFQIAAHEEIIPLDDLMAICRTAREMLVNELGVSRVIARPFIGDTGHFQRTTNRHDFSVKPMEKTLLDHVIARGQKVFAVGKINDIFAGQGISEYVLTKGNDDGVNKTIDYMKRYEPGMIFTNLVDFDMVYGHRNNVKGYAEALEAFDRRIPEIISALRDDDILIISADHGCDPTTDSTDHSREYVPVLAYGRQLKKGINLGTRESFADLGATIAEYLGIEPLVHGQSFYSSIRI
ncbi:phosphopentomutase [Dehalobacter sp. DCM]|uniref:phosphopentomutase n=1 Tax=Dehalobacter sp. DCM TaxID=2907827 RepID=UPI0030817569|nr:phosphopentomutase [Dehalobacter sp. DCM]